MSDKLDQEEPLVSVILPFYKATEVERAIDSILNQTYRSFELILVNNNSPNSEEVRHRYHSIPKVRLVEEKEQGVVFAANKGLAEAKGTYIARMDADDYSYPNRLKLQVEYMEVHRHVDVVAGGVLYQGDQPEGGLARYVDWVNTIETIQDISLNRFVELPMVNPSWMFRRSLVEQHGMYLNGEFPEDYEYFLRLLHGGVQMGKVSQHILQWNDHPKRLTRTDQKYTHEAFFKLKATYISRWLGEKRKQSGSAHYSNLLIWGAGRLSRRRSSYLEEHGVHIAGFIDLKTGENVMKYTDIPAAGSCFVLSYVNNWGARENIRSYLLSKDYVEGLHFLLAS